MSSVFRKQSPAASADLVVIGAGVNGAAVGREAALRGLRTTVVDAEDLCAGTSAASSRMIHGGIRYLEHGEVRLVRESLREREALLHAAPHLTAPYALLIPFYRHNKRRPSVIRTGMIVYDLLSLDKTTPRHRILSRAEVLRRYPGMDPDGLTGAALYFDAQAVLAERLGVELAVDAAAMGADIRTHWKAVGLSRLHNGIEVSLEDTLTGETATVEAPAVVNCTGPWVDRLLASAGVATSGRLVRGSKGSHLIVGRFPGAPETGVHYEARSDGRAVLVLPIGDDRYLIGATDIFVEGDPGEVVCTDEEIDYLLAEVNALIPEARLTPGDVLSSYSGVRPLPYSPEAGSTAEVSRDHHAVKHPELPGLFSVVGGKLTTHRALGELVVDSVMPSVKPGRHRGKPGRRKGEARWLAPLRWLTSRQPNPSRRLILPGGRCADWNAFAQSFRDTSDLGPDTTERLLAVYGVRAERVLATARQRPEWSEHIAGTDALVAEVVVAFTEEFARTLTDVMARRLMLTRRDDVGLGCVEQVAEACRRVAGWERATVQREIEDFRSWARHMRPQETKKEPSTAASTDNERTEET